MTELRFRALSADEMTAEQKRAAAAIASGPRGSVRGPFPALLRSPEMADRIRHLGDYIRFEADVDPALRELAILLVARFWNAQYEWYAHQKLSVAAGLSPSVAEAIGAGQRPAGLTADQTLVYDFTSQLLNDKDVADTTHAAMVARFGEKSVIELICTIGYYGFVSMVLNASRAPIPEGAVPLKPLS
jgi:4-carboxymuconolactone decarboxylase